MAEKKSETFTESDLLDELLVSKRSFQTFAARALYHNVHVQVVVALSNFNDIAPDSAVREQFARSVDALEERIARIARLQLKSKGSWDFSKRFEAIGANRREKVRRFYQWTLQTVGIKDYEPRLTAAQRRQLKAVLRKGLEGVGPDLGPDKVFVIEMLSDLIASR
jgi:hypothetical protein